jgi:hypothetical protein
MTMHDLYESRPTFREWFLRRGSRGVAFFTILFVAGQSSLLPFHRVLPGASIVARGAVLAIEIVVVLIAASYVGYRWNLRRGTAQISRL